MKTTTISYEKSLPHASLYLDDLEKIEEVLTSSCKTVRLEVPGYEFDSVADLQQNRDDTLFELDIVAGEPHVSIRFRPYGNFVRAHTNEPLEVGICEKLHELVRRRRHFLQSSTGWFVVCLFVGFAIAFCSGPLHRYFLGGYLSQGTLGTSLVLCFTIIWSWLLFTDRLLYTAIHLVRRSERPSFFKRKKDELLLILVTAVVSVGSTIAYQQLVGGRDESIVQTPEQPSQAAENASD